MAFLNRVGKLLKQNFSKRVDFKLSASNPSLFEAIRSMSTSSKIFVGGLSYSTDEMSLNEAFSKYGEVVEARVIMDRDTGRSRGFGFVTYTSSEDASSAIQAFDGQELHGRRIRVNYATEKSRSGGFGGGFGSGGGFNYGGPGGGFNYGGPGGGNYGSGRGGDGFGGTDGGNYSGGDGNYTGSGGFGGGNQYPSGGGGFGAPDNFTGGGSNYYGGGSVQDDANHGGSGNNYYTGQSSSSFPLNNESTGTYGQGGIDLKTEDFGQDRDGTDSNDSDEPDDYAKTSR